jgi:hypothetical protein
MPPKTPEPAEEPIFDPPLPQDPEEDEAGALKDFSSLASRLARAAGDADEESRVADAIFARIGRLSKPAQRRLFTRPEMSELFEVAAETETPSRADDPPGTIYYRTINGVSTAWGKKPWTWADAWRFPTKTWRPERRMNLFFSGLAVTVFPRRDVTLPEMFYGIYQDALSNEALAEEHAAYLMKKIGPEKLTDPSIVTPDGAASRAIANHDGRVNVHVPGGGVPALEHAGPGDLDAEPAR